MSHRIRIVTAIVTLTAALLVVIGGGSAAAQTVKTAASDPDVDYHSVHLHLQPTKIAELPIANCSGTWGIGSGHCDGISSSEPGFGPPWTTDWSPCSPSPSCPPGAIAIKVKAGNNHTSGWVLDRGSAGFHVTDADVPGWHPLSPIEGRDVERAGEKGGPLYLDVDNSYGNRYTFDIRGFLLYKKLDRTIELSGYLDYAKKGDVLDNHPFHAKLEILDTPSSPKCGRDITGCTGAFTSDSDVPFRGPGGSFVVTGWSFFRLDTEWIAPSGSKLDGYSPSGNPDRLIITGGNVPEWDARTEITTGTFSGRPGEKGGPLRVTNNACCAAPPRAERPRAKIKDKDVNHKRRWARFKLRAKEGAGKVYLGCKLDDGAFKSCNRRKTYRHLDEGKHVFMVKAKDSSGQVSRKSAKSVFWI